MIAAILLGLLALLAAGFLVRRRFMRGETQVAPLQHEPSGPLPAAPGPPAALPAIDETPPAPLAMRTNLPPRDATSGAGGIDAAMIVKSLQLSLVYATLDYVLVLTNHTGQPSGGVAIAGDLISAHASLGIKWQLNPDERDLAPLGMIETLEPGQCIELTGKLRLPLADAVPLAIGQARMLAPLARFVIRYGDARTVHLFTFGSTGKTADGPLMPLRLDGGPAHFRDLTTRRIDSQGWLPLDPVPQDR